MTQRHRHILFAWLAILAIGAAEFIIALVPFSPGFRPLLLFPALCMVGIVGATAMQVAKGPGIVRVFAVAGLIWLTVMLTLATSDALTRVVHPVSGATLP
jgi:hypothetical protein